MVLIADNLLFLENHSKGSIFHLLRVRDEIAIIWMINGCDFCFIYLHHICTTEIMGHLGPLVIPGDSSIIFLLAEKGLYFNGRIYEYGNKVKLLQRYFFKCFENLFHN